MRRGIIIIMTAMLCALFALGTWATEYRIYFRGPSDGNKLSLTFSGALGDDPFIGSLLDLLEKNNTQASFFICGADAAARYRTVISIRERGHEINMGAYTMQNMADMTYAQISKSIRNSYRSVSYTGAPPTFFRPPFGALSNTIGMAASSRKIDRIVLWTIDADNSQTESWEQTSQYLVTNAHAGAIIRMGMTSTDKTLEILESALPILSSNHRLVTLGELLAVEADEPEPPPYEPEMAP